MEWCAVALPIRSAMYGIPWVGGSAHDYFGVKTRDHEIAIKLKLGRNWYLRTEYG